MMSTVKLIHTVEHTALLYAYMYIYKPMTICTVHCTYHYNNAYMYIIQANNYLYTVHNYHYYYNYAYMYIYKSMTIYTVHCTYHYNNYGSQIQFH